MNPKRKHVSTGSPYEKRVGACRAVRDGRVIAVTGTAPLGSDGKTVGKGDAAVQAQRCLEIIREALEKLGANLSDVIRTRIYLTRIKDWEAVAEVHGNVFRNVRPATTVVAVKSFIDPEWLVEVEADAIAPPSADEG